MNIDLVIIGRDSESHLKDCLEAAIDTRWDYGEKRIFYVDGNSTDQSRNIAEMYPEVSVNTIGEEKPSAAVGRNVGYKLGHSPIIQFIDSDVMIEKEWLMRAYDFLKSNENVVAVKGVLNERFPNKNMFHFAASLEWNDSVGYCEEFGGIVMLKRADIERAGGYSLLKSGEDPDLARRLIEKGGRIYQLDQPMGEHDIDINSFYEWFKRSERTGWTYSSIFFDRSKKKDFFWIKEILRIVIRGFGPGISLSLGIVYENIFPSILFAMLLIFQPIISSIPSFRKKYKLNLKESILYSFHCSIIIFPQAIGMLKYGMGSIGKINHLLIPLVLILSSCSSVKPKVSEDSYRGKRNLSKPEIEQREVDVYQTEADIKDYAYASQKAIQDMNGDLDSEYKVGPGDKLSFNIWNRDRLNLSEIVVGPDGKFQLPRIGELEAEGKTCLELNEEIKKKFTKLYENPEVNLIVTKYNNNRAFVLGRVSSPGLINFQGKGTLLEALSMAGGLPVHAKQSFLTRCAIIRGQNTIVWINLKELLNGNIGLNARVHNGDVIYIPESGDEMAYVMGEVGKPGVISLKGRLSLLDAVMMSGGPNNDANLNKVFLVRQNNQGRKVVEIDYAAMIEHGDQSSNYILKDNDIVYVGARDISKFNMFLNDALPFLKVLSLGSGITNSLGISKTANQK